MTTDTDQLVTARRILHATDNDIEAFLGFFTDTTVFQMGNADPVIGREAIWESGDDVAVRMNVTYRMRGGQSITLPAVTEMKLHADKLTHYLIFMDPSPVTAIRQ
jgi:hypothetical protein